MIHTAGAAVVGQSDGSVLESQTSHAVPSIIQHNRRCLLGDQDRPQIDPMPTLATAQLHSLAVPGSTATRLLTSSPSNAKALSPDGGMILFAMSFVW
jgi:hypothetical protein